MSFALPFTSDPRNPRNPQLPSFVRFVPCLPLSLQSLTTVKFCNPPVLITIRIAGGGRTPFLRSRGVSACRDPLASTSSPQFTQSRVTKSFRIRTYRQTPRFARFWPKLPSRNPFRIRTCKNYAPNSFRMRTYRRNRGASFASVTSFTSCTSLASSTSLPRLASFFSSTYNLELRTKYFSP